MLSAWRSAMRCTKCLPADTLIPYIVNGRVLVNAYVHGIQSTSSNRARFLCVMSGLVLQISDPSAANEKKTGLGAARG